MTTDPQTLIIAILGGIIPSLLWLWFWLNEEEKNPEPNRILAIVFIMGMVAVVCVLPIQKFIQAQIIDKHTQLILFAAAEELLKYLAVMVVLYGTSYIDEPIDWPIYLITAALGFAALENVLFLMKPLSTIQGSTVGLLTGSLRFIGANLLHSITSGILGITVAASFYVDGFKKTLHLFIGFVLAIALHSAFNFFIIKSSGNDFWKVFGFLWVATIIVMLLFEKVRRMS